MPTRQSPKRSCLSVRRSTVAAIFISLGLHAALWLGLRAWPVPKPQAFQREVEVTVDLHYETETPVVGTSSSPVGTEARPIRFAPSGRQPPLTPRTIKPHKIEADEKDAGEEPGLLAMRAGRAEEAAQNPPPSESSVARGNLSSAIDRVASAMVDAEAQRADKDSVKARIARWTRDARAEANVRAGDVPPVWHAIQKRIEESFRPPRGVVSKAPTATALAGQLLNVGAARARKAEFVRPVEPASREAGLAADVLAGQDAFRRPAAWIRAEIVAEVGADGFLRRAEVAVSSGDEDFDKLALEAVCGAIAERPILDGCRRASPCTTRLRWAVEAALRVEPPAMMVPSDRTGGAGSGITPALRFSFDETTGKIKHHRAFESEVCTRVELLSID